MAAELYNRVLEDQMAEELKQLGKKAKNEQSLHNKYESLLEIARKGKVRWFGHVVRAKRTRENTILQGNADRNR